MCEAGDVGVCLSRANFMLSLLGHQFVDLPQPASTLWQVVVKQIIKINKLLLSLFLLQCLFSKAFNSGEGKPLLVPKLLLLHHRRVQSFDL